VWGLPQEVNIFLYFLSSGICGSRIELRQNIEYLFLAPVEVFIQFSFIHEILATGRLNFNWDKLSSNFTHKKKWLVDKIQICLTEYFLTILVHKNFHRYNVLLNTFLSIAWILDLTNKRHYSRVRRQCFVFSLIREITNLLNEQWPMVGFFLQQKRK